MNRPTRTVVLIANPPWCGSAAMGRHFRGYVSNIWRSRQSVQDLSQYTSEEVNAYSAFPPAIQEPPALILAGAESGLAWQAGRLPVESNPAQGAGVWLLLTNY